MNAASLTQKSDSSPKIAVILTGDQNMFTEKRITEEIMKEINKKFPTSKYNVIEDKKVYQNLLIAIEEQNNVDIVALDQLKQKDFVSAGEKYGYDYVMVLNYIGLCGQVKWRVSSNFVH